jgi:ATP-dependent Zn protease
LLENNRDKLEELKDLLIEEEIVDGEKVYELLGKDSCGAYDCSVSFD